MAIEKDLLFDAGLGRKGAGLQSGDDTSFVKTFCEACMCIPVFDEKIVVFHYINVKRMKYIKRGEDLCFFIIKKALSLLLFFCMVLGTFFQIIISIFKRTKEAIS